MDTISLVTGANEGMGREIAAQLAALGHTVVIGARSAERGEKAAAELRAAGSDVTSVVLDLTDPASVAAAAAATEARYGRRDVLINNAGIAAPRARDAIGAGAAGDGLPARPAGSPSLRSGHARRDRGFRGRR